MDAFGTVHVLVANAGILRDKSFTAMTEQEWDAVIAVHLRYEIFIFGANLRIRLMCCFKWHIQVCEGRLAFVPEAALWSYRYHLLASGHLCVT